MDQQFNENKISIAKWIFTGIDFFVVVSVLMLMPKWLLVIFPLYFYLVYFRLNLSVMMLGNEKKSFIGSLAMFAVGVFMVLNTNDLFGGINSHYSGISHVLIRYIDNEYLAFFIWIFLFCWFHFVPLINSIFGAFARCKTNEAKWFDIFTLTYFKRTRWRGRIVNLFFLSLLFVAAQVIGLRLKTIIDSIWCIPMSMIGLWLLACILDIYWKESRHKLFIIAGYVVLLTILWASQYLYIEKRFVMFACYLLGLALSYYTVSKCTENSFAWKITKTVFMTIITLVVFPILTLGYNVFSGMDYVRIRTFQNEAMVENFSEYVEGKWQVYSSDFKRQSFYLNRGVYLITDRDGNIGLRDRIGVIIPTEFEAVDDCMVPYLKVKKDGLWGIYDLSGDSMFRNYYCEGTVSRLLIPCQFVSISPDFKEGSYVVVADSIGNKGVLNLRHADVVDYCTDDKECVSNYRINNALVVPVQFEKIHYVRNDRFNFFIASKQIGDQELFWLYSIEGIKLAENSISIIPDSLEGVHVTDIYGNARKLRGVIER